MTSSYGIDTSNLKDDAPTILLKLFKDVFGDIFRLYTTGFIAEPPPASQMPALLIGQTRESAKVGPTGHDEIEYEITIHAIFNKKDDFGNPDQGSSLERDMNAVASGRDNTTNEYKEKTIMGVLRRNLTIDNLAVENVSDIIKSRPTNHEDSWRGVVVEVRLTEIVPVSNRT